MAGGVQNQAQVVDHDAGQGVTSRSGSGNVPANAAFVDGIATKDIHIDALTNLSIRIFLPESFLLPEPVSKQSLTGLKDARLPHRYRPRSILSGFLGSKSTLANSDEDHEDEGVSSLQHNITTASSALEGLLRKLGARRDDLLPGSMPFSQQSSRLKRILSGLRADAEIGRQTDALSQLCEILSISTEDSLSSFSVDSFVPVLVSGKAKRGM